MSRLERLCGHLRDRLLALFAVALCTGVAAAQQAVPEAVQARATPKDPTELPAGAVLRVGQGHVGQIAGLALLREFPHPPEPMGALAFSPDGNVLCTGSYKGTISLWDTRTGQELGQLAGHSLYVDVVAFAPDGRLLASVSHDGSARLWDLDARKEVRSLPVPYGVALALSRDGRTLAAGGEEG